MTKVDAQLAPNTPMMRLVYRVARDTLVGLCFFWFRMRVIGRDRIPATGPFVLAPVHRSNLDTPIAASVTRRRLRYMGKDSLWRSPFWAWVLSAVGGFPVSRGTADREALKRSLAVVEGGEPLVLFPEGERKSGPLVQPLFEGAAYVAWKTQVPIIPVGIGGSEAAMPKGSRLIYPKKVVVVVGEPIPPPAAEGRRVPKEALVATTARLHEELQAVFDEARIRAGAR